MSTNIESLKVLASVGVDLSDVKKGVSDADALLSKVGQGANSSGVDGFMKGISANLTKSGAALTATVTTPLIAIGTAAIAVGNQFQQAFNTIRVGTGATGDALEALKGDFNAVLSSVPASTADVSKAIADLNTRTGATGPQLQNLSKSVLELSRITGEDLGGVIKQSTRLFGDWGIGIEQQVPTLDSLFKVSQSTGIGVNDLAAKMVQFGGPMRQLGFSFEQASAILGKFEKEGVNTELVMGSLRIALGKMAKEGIKDPSEALTQLTANIKNAGDTGTATAKAIELFGARAGPDMAAAIREGRFEIGALLDQLKNSDETIKKAADASQTLGTRFELLKNKALVAIEPIAIKFAELADKLLTSLVPAFDTLAPIIQSAADWFGQLSPSIQVAVVAVAAIAAAAGPVLLIIGQLAGAVGSITALFGGAGAASGILGTAIATLTGPIGIVIAAVAALAVAYATNFAGIRDKVNDVVSTIGQLLSKLIGFFKDHASEFGKIWEGIKSIVGGVVTAIGHILAALIDVIRVVLKVIQGDWSGAWEALKSAGQNIWEAIKALIVGIVEGLASILFWNLGIN